MTSKTRVEKVRVKARPGRTTSSQRWLQRQLNDPYVQSAQKKGYRSRAAFKLLELNEKFNFLTPSARIVDLGCAPGGWTQVALEYIVPAKGGLVIGIDLQVMDPLPGATLLEGDFMAPELQDQLAALLPLGATVVLSDMAPASTGHKKTDHWRIMGLAETALHFAESVLSPGGTFIAKVLQGGSEKELLLRLKQVFTTVKHVKPPASRADSSEMYVVGLNFKSMQTDHRVTADSPPL